MTEIILEGVAIPILDDGGRAMIVEISGREGSTVFLRLQSWSHTKEHAELSEIAGHRLKITVEVMEDVASDLVKARDEVQAKIDSLLAHRRDVLVNRGEADEEVIDFWNRYRELTDELTNIEFQLVAL